MKRINGMSLTERVRIRVSTIVNSRIEPRTRGRIEARLMVVGRLQEFVFQLLDHVPSRD